MSSFVRPINELWAIKTNELWAKMKQKKLSI